MKEELEEAKRKRRQAERKKAKNKGITIFQQIHSQAKNVFHIHSSQSKNIIL